MPLADFIHLRTHSAYSPSAGAIKIKELVALCRARAMPAAAITDTGNLFGALEFATACAEAGIQPIIGIEIALAPSGVSAGDEVWFVDDTAIDMECAGNSGCVAVFLGDPEPAEEFSREFARFAPRLCFANEASLFHSLEGLRIAASRPSS